MGVTINGVRFSGGTNFSIIGDSVYIDGKAVELTGELESAKVFNIVVEGNAETVKGDFAKIEVRGDAQKVKTMSGNVTVGGSVTGDVGTMSGDVRIEGSVAGNVTSMSGDIRSR